MFVGLLMGGSFLSWGCKDCDCVTATSTPQTALRAEVLRSIAYDVIATSYNELDRSAVRLRDAITTLQGNRTTALLDSARESWRDCRSKWELTFAYLFGPVKYSQTDVHIDTWPISISDLAIDVSTPEKVPTLSGSVRGFHVIEYLLFGDSVNKQVGQITNNEFAYLNALMLDFTKRTNSLATQWDVAGSDYAANIAEAGNSGKIYQTQQDAFQELNENIAFITDVVGSRRIFDALYNQNPKNIESQYSRNTNVDFANIMRSIKNIYTGGYNKEGKGLSTLVLKVNPELDVTVREKIELAIAAIGDMKPWLGQAMFSNKAKLELAIQAINEVQGAMDAVAEITTTK